MTDTTAPLRDLTEHPAAVRGITARARSIARRVQAVANDETGAATAEYAIATMAAVAFAGMLVAIMRSDEVKQILTDLIERALTVP